MVGVSKEVGL